ncbi:MAG: MBL fold metallo-hydrolase [Spirochaetales bacterium]|nr:MBL fold metallo-hydrolase [Spirochaetales bacterium]
MYFFSHFSSKGFANIYILGPDGGGDAVIIDPGIFDIPLLQLIEDNNLYIRHILVTHSHETHTLGIKTILKIYDAEIYCYRRNIMDFEVNKVRDFTKLQLGEFDFEVIETPGHSGDSVTYKYGSFLFTGDTLLAGSVGPTSDDFSKKLLQNSINDKLIKLDGGFFVFPGHGPPSRLEIEKKLNKDLQDY